jgi:hypothetical protein
MLFSPVAATIDWQRAAEWYDKELSQILGQPDHRNRRVDILFKVWLRDGSHQWILLHLEVQSHYEAGFTERLSLYNSGFFWIFKQRVVTLAVLADGN